MKLAASSPRQRVCVDPRFLIGLALVAASVVGVVLVVAASDQSRPVYVAGETLNVGQRIGAGELVEAAVNLGNAGPSYLDPQSMPDDGVIVTRTIAEGELIPLSAVGSRSSADTATVVVQLSGRISADIEAGTVVDLWAGELSKNGGFESPTVLVNDASVVRLVESEGFMVDNQGAGVELLVPSDSVAAVLEAVADESSLSLVTVNAKLER